MRGTGSRGALVQLRAWLHSASLHLLTCTAAVLSYTCSEACACGWSLAVKQSLFYLCQFYFCMSARTRVHVICRQDAASCRCGRLLHAALPLHCVLAHASVKAVPGAVSYLHCMRQAAPPLALQHLRQPAACSPGTQHTWSRSYAPLAWEGPLEVCMLHRCL